MRKVVRGTLGYRDPKFGDDWTDVIYSRDEYYKSENDKRDLENKIKQLERDYNSKIEHYKKSANDMIAEIKAQADERVTEVQTEADKHKNRADSFENANKNLIRVATERANAQRGLTPKKQHIGYVFLSVEEFVFNCECFIPDSKYNKTKILKLPCFRIRLQSPYDIAFEAKPVKDLIYNDFSKILMGKMNVRSGYTEGFIGYSEVEIRKVWSGEETFMFNLVFKANFQKGFWEVEFLARDMPVISPEMTVNKKQGKVVN